MMTRNSAEDELLIEDCEKRESRLTEWEREFVDSVRKQIDNGRSLSTKQRGVLAEIWDKATERG